MLDETPLQKAARLAKEKSEASSTSSSREYKDMNYDEYLAEKRASKKKVSEVSSSGSKSGSKTSTTPSSSSPIDLDNPFNGQTQEEFIGKERANEALRQSALPDNSLEKQAGNIDLNLEKPSPLTGFRNPSVFGDQRTPLQKAESEKLAKVVEAYETANPGQQYNYTQPNSNGSITQGVADEDLKGNWGSFWYNKILEGLGQTASGLGDVLLQMNTPRTGIPRDRFEQSAPLSPEQEVIQEGILKEYREDTAPKIRGFLKKNIGAEVSPTLENNFNDNTFVGAIGGLASSVPSIAGTIANPVLGTSMMASQMFDNSIESINSTEEGRNLDENTKTLFAGGVALVQTSLEKYGLDRILKSKSGIVSDLVAKKAVQQAARKANGQITGDAFSNAINKEVLNLSNKFVTGGARALDGAITEYGTEFGQEATSIFGELLVNKNTGKPIFDTDINGWTKFNKQLSRANKAGVAGLIAGKTLGGLSAMANANANKVNQARLMIDQIDKSLESDQLSETAQKTLIAQKIKLGNQIEEFETKINASYDKLSDDKKEKVNDTVERIFEIQETINDPEISEELKAALSNEITELNTELASINEVVEQATQEKLNIEVGDEITLPTGEKVFVKELHNDNKALVGINTDGIYSEKEIDLPQINNNEQTSTQPQTVKEPNSNIGSETVIDTPRSENSETTFQTEVAASGVPSVNLEYEQEFADKSAEDLASLYNEEVNNPSFTPKERAIAAMPFNTNRESYIQFGGRNNISASKARSYFKQDGLGLDVIAQEINNNSFEGNEVVTPQDLVEFIDRFPNGPNTLTQPSGNTRLRAINNAYQTLTGKRLNQKSAADIVSKQTEFIQNLPSESFNQIDENSIRIIEEEGVTLENIQSLENAIKFVYGDQAYDDLLAHLIFGPLSTNNETGRQTPANITGAAESSGTNSGSSELEGQPDTGAARGNQSEDGKQANGNTGKGGLDSEGKSSENLNPDGEVRPKLGQSNDASENDSLQSTTNTAASDSQAKINEARKNVEEKVATVSSLQNEVNKLSSSLQKNLSENQQDIFGQNKTQSLFDDRAEQQRVFQEKTDELVGAQKELASERAKLKDLLENEGQIDLELKETTTEIDGEVFDLSKTGEDQDAQIIAKSIINPLKIVSEIQKAVDKVENNFSEKFASNISDAIAESMKSWRKSKSALKQVASSYATSILGGIARTNADANAKLGLIGGKNLAVHDMAKVMKAAYEIVDNSTESLERVHVVLDPDFYQQGLGGQSNALNQNVPPNLTYDDLTPKEQMLYDELRKMLDDIHFKNYALGFISKDVFDKHKGTYVPRMYETFELPSEVKEILDTYHGQVGDKLNLNPFKRRKDLDRLSDDSKAAILKDPVYLAAKRQMELDTNSAIMTYINHINRNNRSLVHTGETNVPFNYEKLEGKAYGALDGKYVPSYLAEDLRGYFFVNKGLNNIYDTIKAYDRTWARKGIKKGLTVYNPFVQLGNFTSNIVFAQMAGIDFVRWFGNTPNAIKSLKEQNQDYEDLLGAGLIGTDIIASELIPNTENANSLLQQATAKQTQGPFGKLLSGLKAVDKKLLTLYSGNDDYAKINAYQILKSHQQL
jgi:hypothetical protein